MGRMLICMLENAVPMAMQLNSLLHHQLVMCVLLTVFTGGNTWPLVISLILLNASKAIL